MKLWLIKLGKVLAVLREEGIFRGGKRVLMFLRKMFRRVGKGDILFITGGVGDSARYRTEHVAEELEYNGFVCGVTVQDNPFLLKYADRFSVFVFHHRTVYTPAVEQCIESIKKQRKTILFDTDDLVFDTQYLEHANALENMNRLEKMQYEQGLGEKILSDPYVKACTTTTTYLAEKLRERGKKVFVVPNRLSKQDILVAKSSKQKAVSKNSKEILIGYFSGTKSHDKDFSVAAGALKKVMEKYDQVRLLLVGPLRKGSILEPFAERITSLPYVPRKDHFRNVSSVDINISPLETGNPFCEAKSELKFFEAGAVGVPTVASATQTFREAIRDGVDGFVAGSEEEWFEKLDRLITNADLRLEIGKAARQTALKKYTTQSAQNEEYYRFLREQVVRSKK